MTPAPTPRLPRAPRAALILATLALLASGCSESEQATGITPGATAPTLAFVDPAVVWLVGVPIAPIALDVDGAVTDITVDPALPTGLTFDPVAGVLTGAPLTPLAPTTFTFTATGPEGSASAQLLIDVRASFDAPRAAYSLGFDPPRLSHWRADAETLQLVPGVAQPMAPMPYVAAVHPNGDWLYVGHLGGALSVYALDADTGAPNLTATVPLPPGVVDVEVHPFGRAVYTASIAGGSVAAFAIDPVNGALAPLGAPFAAPGVTDLAVAADGSRLFGASAGANLVGALDLDPTSGAIVAVASVAAANSPHRLAAHPSGAWLAAASFAQSRVLSFGIDGSSGALIPAADIAAPAGPIALAFDPAGGSLRVASFTAQRISTLLFDSASGALTLEQSLAVPGRPSALATLDASGASLLTALFDRAQVLRLDASADPLDPPSDLELAPAQATSSAPVAVAVSRAADGAALVPGPLYVAQRTAGLVAAFEPIADGLSIAPFATPVFAGNAPSGLALDALGTALFVAAEMTSEVRAFALVNEAPVPLPPPAAAGFLTRDVAATRDGRLVFAVSSIGIESFLRTGPMLIPVASVLAGDSPAAIVLSAAERVAYVANRGDGSVSAFRFDAAGNMAQLAGSPFALSLAGEPRALAIAPDGATLYVVEEALNRLSAFDIDPGTGALTQGPSTFTTPAPRGVAVSPDGRYVITADTGVNRLTVFRRTQSGHLEQIQSLPVGLAPRAVVFDTTGRFVASVSFASSTLEWLAFDPFEGALIPLTSVQQGAGAGPVDVVSLARWQDL